MENLQEKNRAARIALIKEYHLVESWFLGQDKDIRLSVRDLRLLRDRLCSVIGNLE